MNLSNQGFHSSLNADGAQILISNSYCLPVLQTHLSNYLHDIYAFFQTCTSSSVTCLNSRYHVLKQEAWLHPSSLFFHHLLHKVNYQFLNIPQFIAVVTQVLLLSQQFHCEYCPASRISPAPFHPPHEGHDFSKVPLLKTI